ncbi:hypothetical protein LTR62_005260 [Meristemomyces frigidus]|uniref:Filamentation protein n=1 Tax=Meristemomyces frigidus TaxID=1508187 RepID=A0AAN7YNQ1_9PEZI|nr:hypothetical protein LTR62_005260 [Meristemomyces frigidus]
MSLTSKAPNPEKGKRYLALLDQALCNGNWTEVPELARKTDKHAPERSCFTLTARTEAQIASASRRPTSASSTGTSSIHSLSEAVPRLQQVITASHTTPDEAYCASACLAEVHWLQEDPEAALKVLTTGVPSQSAGGEQRAPLGWLEVCEVKAGYIRATALEATGHEHEAGAIYRAACAQIPGTRTLEMRRWTTRLLARSCMDSYKGVAQPTLTTLSDSLISFRAWSSLWERAPAPPSPNNSSGSQTDIPRSRVWKAYYDLLSLILRHGIVYRSSSVPDRMMLLASGRDLTGDQLVAAKSRQRIELSRVQKEYGSLLLSETRFPKATEINTEVETWADQAVSNWRLLCSAAWTDEELGEGGKLALGREMLDILYRAATKTFHSTAILRHLFTVHAALGEFDLAMHAFNSYVEIIGKAKARAEKTAQHELGFDDNDTAILTAAEAVRVLCKYGDREHAEKALDVGSQIQKWLVQQLPKSANETRASDDTPAAVEPPQRATDSELQPGTIAVAYRAIGTSKAKWSRTTYDSEVRQSLQAQAIEALKQALTATPNDIESTFILARLLAENNKGSSAIALLKKTLSASQASIEENSEYATQRQLLPLWHIFALCFTANDDYESAIKMCDAGFQQFGEPQNLYGSTSANPNGGGRGRAERGIVDQMDDFEKEGLLELKMSQLTLLELTEGPERTVESINELPRLYARLFGSTESLKTTGERPSAASSNMPPPSRAGGSTLRSIAGSIRPNSNRNSAERNGRVVRPASTAAITSSPGSVRTNGQATSTPIAITVTNEDGNVNEKEKEKVAPHHNEHHLHLPFKLRGHGGDFSRAGSLRSKNSGDDLNKSAIEATDHAHASNPGASSALTTSTSTDPQQPLKQMEHNRSPTDWPVPLHHEDNPPEQDVRLPAAHPSSSSSTTFSHANLLQERQHKTSILVNIWLFVAGLYVRAGFHDDATVAVEESVKLVEAFEAEKEAQSANALALFTKGWGGGKSVDGLWADVWAAKGDLATTGALPFDAMEAYEQSLNYSPDHPEAITGISNLLMDIYEQKLPAERPQPSAHISPSSSRSLLPPNPTFTPQSNPTATAAIGGATAGSHLGSAGRTAPRSRRIDPSPAELNRLACRDRAYMLLASLTKLGTGWDCSEAWFSLARAYELSNQMSKAKQALWWVVHLEEGRGMRGWGVVRPGEGYAL